MSGELQKMIAEVFEGGSPELAETIRELKAKGAKKSDVVRLVKSQTRGNEFMASGLLTMIDELWK